jgi:hypothetical protein
MMDEHVLQLILATVGAVGFLALFIARLGVPWGTGLLTNRLLLVDALLVVAGVELVADALHDIDLGEVCNSLSTLVAYACRGALIAGSIALLATLDGHRVMLRRE